MSLFSLLQLLKCQHNHDPHFMVENKLSVYFSRTERTGFWEKQVVYN